MRNIYSNIQRNIKSKNTFLQYVKIVSYYYSISYENKLLNKFIKNIFFYNIQFSIIKLFFNIKKLFICILLL